MKEMNRWYAFKCPVSWIIQKIWSCT